VNKQATTQIKPLEAIARGGLENWSGLSPISRQTGCNCHQLANKSVRFTARSYGCDWNNEDAFLKTVIIVTRIERASEAIKIPVSDELPPRAVFFGPAEHMLHAYGDALDAKGAVVMSEHLIRGGRYDDKVQFVAPVEERREGEIDHIRPGGLHFPRRHKVLVVVREHDVLVDFVHNAVEEDAVFVSARAVGPFRAPC